MIKFEIKRSGWFKNLLGFGKYKLYVVIDDGLFVERETTYHATYDDAEDYFYDVYHYEISDFGLGHM